MSQAGGRLRVAVSELATHEGPLKSRLVSAVNQVICAIPNNMPLELCERLKNLQGKFSRSEPAFDGDSRMAATIRGMGRKELAKVAYEIVLLCHDVTAHEGPVGPRLR